VQTETLDEPSVEQREDLGARPALLLIWSAEEPQQIVLPLVAGALEIGRDGLAAVGIPDGSSSRRHARIELDRDRWSVSDLGSRNGTLVDGRHISAVRGVRAPVIRIGRTLLLAMADAAPQEPSGEPESLSCAPPLRERRREIPWLIARALGAAPAQAAGARHHASAEFVEACLLRSWPGGARELLAETALAALAATAAGRSTLAASDLDAEAGRALDEEGQEPTPPVDVPAAPGPSADDMETALRGEQGNIARAAARLGMARSRLRRFIDRSGIDVKALQEG
jgi:hypothetical protein